MLREGFMEFSFCKLLKAPICAFKYRDRQSIVADILKAVSKSNKGKRKTHIMRAAHLNSVQANRYLEVCFRNGYVVVDGYRYRLSEKGLRFIENVDSEMVKIAWRR
jgi:predicted transcriptional regulator